jgi:hypothetical protein
LAIKVTGHEKRIHRETAMKMLDHFISLVTLVSLVILGPALGKAIFRNPKGPVVLAFGTMLAVSLLLALYGIIWTVRPRSIAWYTWLANMPVNGNVDVSGSIATDVSEPLRVQIER